MKPKSFLLAVLGTAGLLALALAPRSSHGQAGADDPLLSPVIAEVAKQQAQLVANQNKIDETLALIAEDLRVARIFAGRGGGKTK